MMLGATHLGSKHFVQSSASLSTRHGKVSSGQLTGGRAANLQLCATLRRFSWRCAPARKYVSGFQQLPVT